MQIQPYLLFNDRCDETIEFYTRTLGAQLADRMCFSDNPEPAPACAEGGQVQMPIGPTFLSQRFGMVADRFSVSWMVIAAA